MTQFEGFPHPHKKHNHKVGEFDTSLSIHVAASHNLFFLFCLLLLHPPSLVCSPSLVFTMVSITVAFNSSKLDAFKLSFLTASHRVSKHPTIKLTFVFVGVATYDNVHSKNTSGEKHKNHVLSNRGHGSQMEPNLPHINPRDHKFHLLCPHRYIVKNGRHQQESPKHCRDKEVSPLGTSLVSLVCCYA
jgi:hypothetical protein